MEIGAIQKRIAMMEKCAEEIRISKEMLKGELENSAEYLQVEEEVKESQKKKKEVKEQILASEPNQKLVTGIKENQEELSTLRDILSAELAQYFKENDDDSIKDADGEVRKLVVNVKITPKRGQKRDGFGQYEKE